MTPTHKTDRRGFLKAGLSLGALSLLTGCDLTDNEAAQRLLWNMSWWNDRVQAGCSTLIGWRRLTPRVRSTASFATTPFTRRSRRRSSTPPPTGWSSAAPSATSGHGPSMTSTCCRRCRRSPGMSASKVGAGSANGAAARCGSSLSGSRRISPKSMSVSSAPTVITPASTCRRCCTHRRLWLSPSPTRYCRASSVIRSRSGFRQSLASRTRNSSLHCLSRMIIRGFWEDYGYNWFSGS